MSAVVTRMPETMPIPHREGSDAIVQMIERAARDPSIDIAKLRELIELRNQAAAQEWKREFSISMSSAQTEMRPVATDATNPQTRSKYASYPALDRALRPIYTKHGFSLSFNTSPEAPENCVRVLCYVEHNSGHGRTYHIDMPADGKGAKGGDVMSKTHATGSAVTYGMRYLLKMIFNIAVGADDDGNSSANSVASGPINEGQLRKLIDTADEIGADKIKLCKYLGIPSLADLPASRFAQAMAALEKKRAKVAS